MEFAAEIKMHHATRAKAVRLVEMLAAEYPRLTLEVVPGDVIDHETYTNDLGGFEVVVDGDDVILESDKVPEIADIIDACAEAEIDPVGDEDDEDEHHSRNIVPEKYRQLYKEVSTTGQSNGDWLAEQLANDTLGADGKLNIDDLTRVFEVNGLDMGAKWATARHTRTRGWQGRYRMSGRAVLERLVALRGVYVDPTGNEMQPSPEWMADMEHKHRVWLAKERKRAEDMDAALRG